MGDGGGCPDEEGRFNCCHCGRKLPKNAPSALCERCRRRASARGWDDECFNDYDR